MRVPGFVKYVFLALVLVLLVVCGIIGGSYLFYPYGNRGSGLLGVTSSLRNYASDHGGWFPSRTGSALQCLKMLYPYDDSGGLAGLSGSLQQVRQRIQLGLDLDERVSSLVYLPGLRDNDDSDPMIIYERQAGISTTGKRASGHAVGFVGGNIRQIPQDDWERFLKDQETLRRKLIASRATPTNTDLLATGANQ